MYCGVRRLAASIALCKRLVQPRARVRVLVVPFPVHSWRIAGVSLNIFLTRWERVTFARADGVCAVVSVMNDTVLDEAIEQGGTVLSHASPSCCGGGKTVGSLEAKMTVRHAEATVCCTTLHLLHI